MYKEEASIHIILSNMVESKTFRLINFPHLAECLPPLSNRRNIAFLSILYSYFHTKFSYDLDNCMYSLIVRSC